MSSSLTLNDIDTMNQTDRTSSYDRTPPCSPVSATQCSQSFHDVQIDDLKPATTHYYQITPGPTALRSRTCSASGPPRPRAPFSPWPSPSSSTTWATPTPTGRTTRREHEPGRPAGRGHFGRHGGQLGPVAELDEQRHGPRPVTWSSLGTTRRPGVFLEHGVDVYLAGHISRDERLLLLGANGTVYRASVVDNNPFYANPGKQDHSHHQRRGGEY